MQTMNRPLEFDLVRYVDIEASSGCTRKCSFCDPGVPKIRRTNPAFISLDIVSQICNELKQWEYDGSIILAGHGEPMMHPHIDEIIGICKSIGVNVVIFTNGDLLTDKTYNKIIGADEIVYDQYTKDDKLCKLLKTIIGSKLGVRHQYTDEAKSAFNSRCGAVWMPTKEQFDKVKYSGCQCIQSKICIAADGYWYSCCMDIKHHHKWGGGIFDLFSNQEYLNMRDKLKVDGAPNTPRAHLIPCKYCETTDL